MEVVSSSWSASSAESKEAREHIRRMVSCVVGHFSAEYGKLCTARGRVPNSVEMRILEQFDSEMLIAKRQTLGKKAPHQGGMVLPDGIIWVPNGAIKREKQLSGGSYGETHTCFVRGSLFFDECVLYCVKQYKAHSQTIATTECNREILASRIHHPGIV
ncbi:hypothetical protein R1flu_001133 [Riccia fluitans]|uniref:Uncharacterized protein n=1 Tax=Riccia fluitans TaxID=41844 RepID=A0ABD1Y2L9_9MARC